ncbi:DNA-processing protein DprA, partial [Mobilicoccus pelagius]
ATVVVEAGARSGSMKVAERAQELGRIVGAVPGPVTSATSAGPHRLLRDKDCAVITDAADLYRALETRDVERGSSASLLMPERTVSSAWEMRQL